MRGDAGGGVREQVLALVGESSRALGFDPVVLFDGPLDTVTTEQVATNLLAVLRESLANIARHAQATNVEIAIAASSTEITIDIRDNGIGIADGRRPGNGLRNIDQRARHLGGASDVTANDEGGTNVHWAVPVGGSSASSTI